MSHGSHDMFDCLSVNTLCFVDYNATLSYSICCINSTVSLVVFVYYPVNFIIFFFTSKPLISCSENALKLTYNNVEFQKFSRGEPPDTPFKGRAEDSGEGRGKKRGGEMRGKRMRGINGTSAP